MIEEAVRREEEERNKRKLKSVIDDLIRGLVAAGEEHCFVLTTQ